PLKPKSRIKRLDVICHRISLALALRTPGAVHSSRGVLSSIDDLPPSTIVPTSHLGLSQPDTRAVRAGQDVVIPSVALASTRHRSMESLCVRARAVSISRFFPVLARGGNCLIV